MAQGLGALAEGLQGGIKARGEMDRDKAYNRLLTQKGDEADRMFENRQATDRTAYLQEFGNTEGYVPAQRTKIQDPALLRLGKFVGGKIKGFFTGGGEEEGALQTASFATPEIQAPIAGPQTAIPGQTDQVPKRYADGGQVEFTDEERKARSYGEYYTSEDTAAENRAARSRGERRNRGQQSSRPDSQYSAGVRAIPTEGGGIPAFYEDMVNNAEGPLSNTFQSIDNFRSAGADSVAHIQDAEGARETGDRHRTAIGDAAGAVANVAGGIATDLGLDKAVDFAKGFVGFDGGEGIPSPDTSNEADVQAAGAAIDAPDQSNAQVAETAMSEGQQLAVENLNYQLLAEQGVGPEELPSMNTKDWSEHRYNVFRSEMDRGVGVKAAYEAMDSATVDMQMKGMMRDLDKAVYYLQAGDNKAAALAMRQSYQYFPNGVDVKFGTAVDPKTGQPAIITMGYDEETGEPKGKPMLITVDRLSTMRENFTNPQAFRAWTKDGHDLQMEVNKLQSQDDYRQGSLQNQRDRNDISLIGALAGGQTGLKTTDRDRRDSQYRQRLEMEGLDDPRLQDSLSRAMSEYEQMTGSDTTVAMDEIMEAYVTGEFEGVAALLESLRR